MIGRPPLTESDASLGRLGGTLALLNALLWVAASVFIAIVKMRLGNASWADQYGNVVLAAGVVHIVLLVVTVLISFRLIGRDPLPSEKARSRWSTCLVLLNLYAGWAYMAWWFFRPRQPDRRRPLATHPPA